MQLSGFLASRPEWAGVMILACAFVACSKPSSNSDSKSYVVSNGSGTVAWPSKVVDVCWEGAANLINPTLTTAIADSVKAEYGKAGITLSGWSSCTGSNTGIRVQFNAADQPHTLAFGRQLSGLPNNMVITDRPLNGQLAAGRCGDATSAQHCLKTIAMHEFGHALGLAHEANRPDGSCKELDQTGGRGQDGAVAIGSYDAFSIMNYCHLSAVEAQTDASGWLSASDIAVLTDMYQGLSMDALKTKYSGSGAVAARTTTATSTDVAVAKASTATDPSASSSVATATDTSVGTTVTTASGRQSNGCLIGWTLEADGLCYPPGSFASAGGRLMCPAGMVLYTDGYCYASTASSSLCPAGMVLYTDGYCRGVM